jgi:hypothetical protein
MGSGSRANSYAIELGRFSWSYGNRVAISLLRQPLCDRGRSEERNVSRKGVERIKRQMIRVRMCQQYGVEFRQCVKSDTGSADTREKFAERWIEIGVGENSLPPDFN